jgi:hypothetical protein
MVALRELDRGGTQRARNFARLQYSQVAQRGTIETLSRFHEVKHMTLLPVSINLVDQSNPSNRADPRLLTQQEFAHLLELANDAVRSEALDAQDREQAEYMKNNATWD